MDYETENVWCLADAQEKCFLLSLFPSGGPADGEQNRVLTPLLSQPSSGDHMECKQVILQVYLYTNNGELSIMTVDHR